MTPMSANTVLKGYSLSLEFWVALVVAIEGKVTVYVVWLLVVFDLGALSVTVELLGNGMSVVELPEVSVVLATFWSIDGSISE